MIKKFLFLMIFSICVFAQDSALFNIVKNVSIPDVETAIKDAKALKANYSDENFTNFIRAWKKVEALYFAGEIDDDYLDTPRYMDVFNNLKEDLNSQMQRVIDSNDDPKKALFKNSFKTVNALEYVLYSDKTITDRKKAIAGVIIDSLVSKLEDIKGAYEEFLTSKPKDEKFDTAIVINTLIASTYRLKEWRIGNASGSSSKFKNDPNNNRAEYFLSQNSFAAIDAILDAQKEILEDKNYYNFASLSKKLNAQKELKVALDKIIETKEKLSKLKKDDFSKAQDLFESARALHNAYYLSLIDKLGLKANVLDADGD
ncbi:imelysin family protein [Aliarcobacter butzleri]|uniref:Imelysin family protein n=2 Tax=Aliarcobacter butzleri TaxID=28197 RepID=A0AAW7PUW5_9BACT|nr:imelysin family protein [Aliarcobacter butzleri]MCP3650490.1 imelysin family protein [Arcobacter sp. DNRA7]KLE02480.1 imelysin [Aliarcobacter butzleri L348]KLE04932.1 imelysin [Aliarcobacter butzleri L353]MBF7066479.1 imelysin [Aliarcobacter butzleri]MCG3652578.1 imelysin family protein [Aliarcobacter butzleri]